MGRTKIHQPNRSPIDFKSERSMLAVSTIRQTMLPISVSQAVMLSGANATTKRGTTIG